MLDFEEAQFIESIAGGGQSPLAASCTILEVKF